MFDDKERAQLCDLMTALGPDAPTLLGDWTTLDLAAHLYLRENDALAGPGLVLAGPWSRLAERHRVAAKARSYAALLDAVRAGPRGLFRIAWVRHGINLNEFFVHHEDVRRAQGEQPRQLNAELNTALWGNACSGGGG